MATDARHTRTRPVVQRYSRVARWFHAGVYVAVLTLLATGVWLLIGREGRPSPLSLVVGTSDARLHVLVGWAFAGLVAAGVVLGVRGTFRFVVETLRFDRGDLRWFARWPTAVLTGRFPRHEGRFDPGQRIANVAIVLALAAVTGSGAAMAWLHGGPAYVWLVPLHKWSTYLLAPLLLAHGAIASGMLPGYRGVWRSMHLGGRLPVAVARRLWPAWVEQHERAAGQHDGGEEDGRMKTRLTCPCGTSIVGTDEDDLVEKTQAHLAEAHPGMEYDREQILFIAT